MRRASIALRVSVVAGLWLTLSHVGAFCLRHHEVAPVWWLLWLLVCLAGLLLHLSYAFAPVRQLVRAIAGTVASHRDGDFSFSLSWPRNDELGELVSAHNRLGDALRAQRQDLVHRELLLDTVVQNSPLAMLLTNDRDHVVLANLTARRLLGDGSRLEGQHTENILNQAPEAFRHALGMGSDSLFSVGEDDDAELFHLSRRRFMLNGREHTLTLIKQLTTELRRQEVQTWKKVIRIISHELNNSLAPIVSLAHSGSELLRREQTERLEEILGIIEDRARHLEGFIRGYAHFAKLPAPNVKQHRWQDMLDALHAQVNFVGHLDDVYAEGHFDRAQLEQALINLLKNAIESGSAPDEVSLATHPNPNTHGHGWMIEVRDRGPGMSEAVIAKALLPFYSTKRQGTGLGLALSREIIEAHHGSISLHNRDGGGLCVRLHLPDLSPAPQNKKR